MDRWFFFGWMVTVDKFWKKNGGLRIESLETPMGDGTDDDVGLDERLRFALASLVYHAIKENLIN